MKKYYAQIVMVRLRRYYPVLPAFPEMRAGIFHLLAAVPVPVVTLAAVIAAVYSGVKHALTAIPQKTGIANLPLYYGEASDSILCDYVRKSYRRCRNIV